MKNHKSEHAFLLAGQSVFVSPNYTLVLSEHPTLWISSYPQHLSTGRVGAVFRTYTPPLTLSDYLGLQFCKHFDRSTDGLLSGVPPVQLAL